jgi:soluble lytic murein transglycosylase-like protein
MIRYGMSLAVGLVFFASADAGATSETRELKCIEASARFNGISPQLLLAVRQQEGGRPGFWHRNANGSFDYGVMQINSRWLPVLAPRGYTAAVLTDDVCASIAAGAWILAKTLFAHSVWNLADADPMAFWKAVGEYHSFKPGLNRTYAELVWARYRNLLTGRRP